MPGKEQPHHEGSPGSERVVRPGRSPGGCWSRFRRRWRNLVALQVHLRRGYWSRCRSNSWSWRQRIRIGLDVLVAFGRDRDSGFRIIRAHMARPETRSHPTKNWGTAKSPEDLTTSANRKSSLRISIPKGKTIIDLPV